MCNVEFHNTVSGLYYEKLSLKQDDFLIIELTKPSLTYLMDADNFNRFYRNFYQLNTNIEYETDTDRTHRRYSYKIEKSTDWYIVVYGRWTTIGIKIYKT